MLIQLRQSLKQRLIMMELWQWILDLFRTRYKLTVSYNDKFGDQDDKEYIVKKFKKQSENHISFIDNNGKLVEVRSVSGLHYRVEEL